MLLIKITNYIDCKLDIKEATYIADVLRLNSSLESLQVREITAEGTKVLSEALLSNSTLLELTLCKFICYSTKTTDFDGVEDTSAIAKALLVNTSLRSLKLLGVRSNNPLSLI